jgi:hypothetical protein
VTQTKDRPETACRAENHIKEIGWMRSKKKSPAHAGMRYSGTKHSENADLPKSSPLLQRRFSQNHNWHKPDHTANRLKLRRKFAKPIRRMVNRVLYEQPIQEPEEQTHRKEEQVALLL